jgi:hypothetical protein
MIKDGWRIATLDNFRSFHLYPTGDTLFVSTSDSFLGWLVMYYTSSVFSHVAIVNGNGIVTDVTTAGIAKHSFADYLDGKSYLMVLGTGDQYEGQDKKLRKYLDSTLGRPYGWHKIVRMFLQIVFGSHVHFSWKFYFDFLLLMLFLCGTVGLLVPAAVVPSATAIALYTSVVVANRHRWNKQKRESD